MMFGSELSLSSTERFSHHRLLQNRYSISGHLSSPAFYHILVQLTPITSHNLTSNAEFQFDGNGISPTAPFEFAREVSCDVAGILLLQAMAGGL
jgi:hypothetical protein